MVLFMNACGFGSITERRGWVKAICLGLFEGGVAGDSLACWCGRGDNRVRIHSRDTEQRYETEPGIRRHGLASDGDAGGGVLCDGCCVGGAGL